ncbi:hypothetical protein AURDEDRAFT_113887 [Auricularia subglabra TFB-10046 SS5]|nr:hypothetical protein AURDEDRAFT_113887 [Auricularia subglabra TFB-10046 SS5]
MTLSLVTAAFLALPALVAGQKPTMNNPFLFQPGLATPKCLQPRGGSQAAGTQIVLADCTGATEQKIFWEDKRVRVFDNMCFTTSGNSTNGAPIKIAACNAGDNSQSWYFNFFGGNQFKHNPSGKCVDLSSGNTAAGTPVQLWDCNKGNPNQIWNTGYLYNQLPAKTQPNQSGTNQCGTGSSNSSMCQTAWLNDVDDFCLWAPATTGTIGNKEREVVAYCTKSGRGARTIPDGSLSGVHFVKTKDFVQITGVGKLTSMHIPAGDAGGELDPHGPDGYGNPVGGHVYGNSFGPNQQYHEWTSFISSNEFCFRACIGPNAQKYCEHIYDVMGCYWNMPANYNANVFESCDGDSGQPMGIYSSKGADGQFTTTTWKQGQNPTPAAHPVPSSSNCRKISTVKVGPVGTQPPTSPTTTTSGPTTTTTQGPAPTGKLIKSQANTNKCITAASNADGAKLTISDCNNSAGQLFTQSGNTLKVFGDKCIDVTEGVNAKGTKLQIWTCSSTNQNQMWTYNNNNDAHITWISRDKSIDVTDGVFTNGNQLQIWQRSTTTKNQQWTFA